MPTSVNSLFSQVCVQYSLDQVASFMHLCNRPTTDNISTKVPIAKNDDDDDNNKNEDDRKNSICASVHQMNRSHRSKQR